VRSASPEGAQRAAGERSPLRLAGALITPFRLRLREPVSSARGPLAAREGWLLALEADSGTGGHGEAMPLAGFATEAPARCRAALERAARALLAAGPLELEAALGQVARLCAREPAARAALDAALHDLFARERGCSIAALLAAAPHRTVAVSALVPGEAPEAVARAARRARGAGHHTFKLKLGGRALELDLERVAALREAAGPGARLRLDANGAWEETQARRALEALAAFAPEFVEQPVAAGDLAALARLRASSPVPVAADESVAGEEVAGQILAARAADFLVLKLAPLGGLAPALRVARRAREAGVGVVVTSGLDSTLGIAAAAQLAAALPVEGPAAGLASAELLAQDLAAPLAVKDGALELPAEPGLGRAPDPARVARVACAPLLELRA
jgi:o-succinylbenzoate synthase